MTNIPHQPRSRVVLRYTREAVRAKALTVLPFSADVSADYLRHVQPEDRVLRFREDGDTADSALKAQKHNWQLVDRLISGASREFHADLEEFWVEHLPEPFRTDCRHELTRRYGFIAATPLESQEQVMTEGLPGLAREFGETMSALAPILADGKIDANDLPHVRKALQEGSDLVAQWLSIQKQLIDILPAGEALGAAVVPLRRNASGVAIE